MAAKQQTTRQWWDDRREHFELFISDPQCGTELSGRRRRLSDATARTGDKLRRNAGCLIEDAAQTAGVLRILNSRPV